MVVAMVSWLATDGPLAAAPAAAGLAGLVAVLLPFDGPLPADWALQHSHGNDMNL